jgi:hypothetical protein
MMSSRSASASRSSVRPGVHSPGRCVVGAAGFATSAAFYLHCTRAHDRLAGRLTEPTGSCCGSRSRLTTTGTQTNAGLKPAGRPVLGKVHGQRRLARVHCGARVRRRRLPSRRPHGASQHFRPQPRCRPRGGTTTAGLRHSRPTVLTGAVDRCRPRGAGCGRHRGATDTFGGMIVA